MLKRTIGMLSLVLLTILMWTYEVPAASWDFIYECNEIPDDPALGDDVWGLTGTTDICEITPDGELHIIDPADKTCHLLQAIEDGEKATVEARVKVLSQAGVSYTVLLGIEDGARYTWVNLYPDYIQLDGGDSYTVDMTEYHILRIARDGDDVTVYVDDEEVIAGQPGGTGDRKDIIFGSGSTGGTGEHYWDYVVFTTEGAFSPEELPNYPSTLAVESKGKAATCWGMIKSR